MNSTVQCLHSVPELKSALIKYPPPVRSSSVDQSSHSLTVATRELFGELDKNVKPVAPMRFLTALRSKYPQFAQLHNGIYMQQDAEECWTQLLFTLSLSLKAPSSSEDADTVKRLFGIDLVSRVHCAESGEESTETEVLNQNWRSPHLLWDVVLFTQKNSRINDLPRYLTIQFVRFFWKRETNQKAKILRKVDYPLELDVYDLCSDDLRKRLEAPRRLLRDEEGKRLGLKTNESSSSSTDNDVKMTDAEGPSNGSGNSSKSASGEDVPPEKEKHPTGIYDLVAVLTHKGRSADSGHYVAWVKQENGKWIQFDDDNPIPQREEDITRLSGALDNTQSDACIYKSLVLISGDWHMAYICMYKARDVSM
ncbi:Ubiquitin carboxyl-terminal hydrolase 6 [Sesamum angolense]|uniref:ubiquitinyl hydrolase 1 n=1 Tax=Sesamum angolense TaxID=2727404 RepID=A0AAE1WKX0_9LAMI|nr:Ubiquitin carboxyl-terminal hydrolase 6 [Sesamum angolense]